MRQLFFLSNAKMLLRVFVSVVVLFLSFLSACNDEDDKEIKPLPEITAISPDSSVVGDTILISGKNFSNQAIKNVITFSNNIEAFGIISASATEIYVTVPPNAVTGPVTITVDGQSSIGKNFKVRTTTPVSILEVSPAAAYFGDTVTIKGTGFKPGDFLNSNQDGSRNASVFFGSSNSSGVTISATATEQKVIVPVNAVSGQIGILYKGGMIIEGPQFTVSPPLPTITSFTPESGFEGTVVVIEGTKFIRDVQVTLNGTVLPLKANVKQDRLEVSIPTGIEPGSYPIKVTAQGNEVTSTSNFTVTTPPVADRFLYFTQGGDIVRASISEQNGQVQVNAASLFASVGSPIDVVIDKIDNKIYWTDPSQYGIIKGNLDGSGTPIVVFGLANVGNMNPFGLALSNGKLYWSDANSGYIYRGNVDGTNPEVIYGDIAEEGVSFALDIEVEGNNLYWTEINEQQIVKGVIDGSTTPEVLFDGNDGLISPQGLQLDVESGRLYVVDSPFASGLGSEDRIMSGNLDGTANLTTLYDAADRTIGPAGISLDKEMKKIYWTNFDYAVSKGNLVRANSEGNGDPELLIDNIDYAAFGIIINY